jgi:uncharacterized protein YggU (UPF0235/DUF167 family)
VTAKLNLRVENVTVKPAAHGDKLVQPEEVRKHLIEAINSIPVDKLRGFRGGQVTIVS